MQNEVDNLVHTVLRHGIQLKDRLRKGEEFDLKNEQAVLKRLLLTDEQARQLPEFGSDAPAAMPQGELYGTPIIRDRADMFLGVRYALVCWLDEIFLIDSPWDSAWNENKLELALYGSNDRAFKFWEQARLAETRANWTALRAFFFCVMLGFRGDYRDDPSFLAAWVDAARKRLGQADMSAWVKPPDREIATAVPPLFGREMLRRMVMTCGTLLIILIPLVAYFFVCYMDRTTPGLSTDPTQRPGYGKKEASGGR